MPAVPWREPQEQRVLASREQPAAAALAVLPEPEPVVPEPEPVVRALAALAVPEPCHRP